MSGSRISGGEATSIDALTILIFIIDRTDQIIVGLASFTTEAKDILRQASKIKLIGPSKHDIANELKLFTKQSPKDKEEQHNGERPPFPNSKG